MYEIVCSVQEQVCCRKVQVCCQIATKVQAVLLFKVWLHVFKVQYQILQVVLLWSKHVSIVFKQLAKTVRPNMLLMTKICLMFKAIKESLHIIVIISFILVLCVPHPSDTHCRTNKDRCRISYFSLLH